MSDIYGSHTSFDVVFLSSSLFFHFYKILFQNLKTQKMGWPSWHMIRHDHMTQHGQHGMSLAMNVDPW